MQLESDGAGADPGTKSELGEVRTEVEADAARQAAPGGKPGMLAMEQTTTVANVFEIDRAREIVTLRGSDGVPVDIKVADENALDQIKLNDQIVIGCQQCAALSVEPGQKAKNGLPLGKRPSSHRARGVPARPR